MKGPATASPRLYYVDWLRVLAMFGIFFFHNSRFYDSLVDWHVKNATTNIAASVVVAFMSQWIMPLFFLIAGAGTYYALKSRKVMQYVQERTLRLLVPLIFGMLVIVVPQAYFQALYQGYQPAGYNVFQIYGLYLQSLPDMNWFHLWFLVDLFLLSLVTVPLFYIWSGPGKSLISRLAAALNRPWFLLPLLVLSVALVDMFLFPDGFFGYRNGGFNIVAYLLFFVFGYLIFADPRIMEWIGRLRWFMLGTGVIALVLAFVFAFDELADPVGHFGSTGFYVSALLQSLSTWGWLLAILGLGKRYLERNNRFLSYANEAVLPFYILHQTVIISIGYFVVQWDTGVGLKYLTISTTSFIAIMLIYEVLVRRINVLRFLFGMRLKNKPLTQEARKAVGARALS